MSQKASYEKITICRSCGEVIRREKVESEFRTKPVHSIMPPEFCRECSNDNIVIDSKLSEVFLQ